MESICILNGNCQQKKNTIKDGGSTALYADYTVDMVFTVDMVNAVDM